MNFEAIIAALASIIPNARFWCEASTGEITVETGLRHRWPAGLSNRVKFHLPYHSVSLCPQGKIRLHTGIKLTDIPL